MVKPKHYPPSVLKYRKNNPGITFRLSMVEYNAVKQLALIKGVRVCQCAKGLVLAAIKPKRVVKYAVGKE